MRRSLISQFHCVKRRKGVTARLMHRKYRVQSPVPRVMNSSGSTSCPVYVSQTMRANGSSASKKIRLFSSDNCLLVGLRAMVVP
ncbi:hypothetical protein D3C72_2078940 [compost metagenome]